MSIKPKVETALAATAERLSPGAGTQCLKDLKSDVAMIDTSSENLDSRYAHEEVAIAAPVVFEAKHPEGDPVTIGKRHDGLIAVFSDSFIFVRGIGFGAREVKTLRKDEISVEPVTTVLEGVNVPGLRIPDHRGKPKFTLAIALPSGASDVGAQQSVRDEVTALLTT
jgi:hypothetical protein